MVATKRSTPNRQGSTYPTVTPPGAPLRLDELGRRHPGTPRAQRKASIHPCPRNTRDQNSLEASR